MGWVNWPFEGLQGWEIESPYWFEGFEVRKIQILGLGPGFLSQDFGVPIIFFSFPVKGQLLNTTTAKSVLIFFCINGCYSGPQGAHMI
jgi:hypothetical protein